MVRFAHIADVHLGGWKQQPLQELNMDSFRKAIKTCIEQKVDFTIMAGDIFDSAFPPIDTLKEAFREFRRLKEAGIPCFIIAGSHDYSVSGKTFLDVLEKAGFCKNVTDIEEKDEKIILNPTIYKGVAIYGYPGKTSGLEIADLRRVKLNESPGMFRIFMLHTTIDKAKGTLPIDAFETDTAPEAEYYALGHLHIDFQYENFVYPGPIFPNNFQELEDLQYGRFCIIDTEAEPQHRIKRIPLKIRDVLILNIQINDSISATSKIISELEKNELEGKVILLRIKGTLESGKNSDIKFTEIEEFAQQRGAYFVLRNTHDLKMKEEEFEIEINESNDIEDETIKSYSGQNDSQFNKSISQLMNAFIAEKQEGETTENFTNRVMDDARKILKF
ncbi:MAG: DNA repair exonuclease [Nanoarchaeota archaeon]|nr:DNA repair exonuclease [Nanoarchaeota archaeon]